MWLSVSPFRFTVHGLKTGEEYVFRVKSVSPAGNSSYSDQSQPILVKAAVREFSCQTGVHAVYYL